ncbi:MAG: chemotaxis protein CheC [Nitrospirales bacterium]
MPKKMIVDDSLSQGRTIIAIARDLGYDSEMTEKGPIGLGNITARTPDCVMLANRLMSETKGMQILENLSESKIRVPVVERAADTQDWMTGQIGRNPPVGSSCKRGIMPLTPVQLDTIREIMNISMGRAAGALNQMMVRPIRLSIPAMKFGRKEALFETIRLIGSDLLVSIRLPFRGSCSGSAFLVFPTQHSEKLSALVTGENSNGESMNMFKAATCTEIGHVVINGVMESLRNILQQKILNSVSRSVETSLSAIVEENYLHDAEYILWAEIRLTIEGIDVSGDMLLMLGIQDLELLRNAIDALIGINGLRGEPVQSQGGFSMKNQSRANYHMHGRLRHEYQHCH